jgi:hypothetical protein
LFREKLLVSTVPSKVTYCSWVSCGGLVSYLKESSSTEFLRTLFFISSCSKATAGVRFQ